MRTWSEARGAAAPGVPRTLLVCTTPRSGSGVLCEALSATGRAGLIDEYLHLPVAAKYAAEWGVPPGPAWLERLLLERSPNGVLGVKAMWSDFEAALAGRGPVPSAGDGPAGFLTEWPGPLVCVHLTRRDRVRQAISMWRASATGQFRLRDGHAAPPARPLPEFRASEVENRLRELEEGERGWEGWFRAARLRPLRLVYEDDVAEGPGPAASKVLAVLGEDPPAAAVATTFRRQSDTWTERMIALFEASREVP